MSWRLDNGCRGPPRDHLFVTPRRPRQAEVVASENRHATTRTSSFTWLRVDPKGFPALPFCPLGRRCHPFAAEVVFLAEDDVSRSLEEVTLQWRPPRRIGRIHREGEELLLGRAINKTPQAVGAAVGPPRALETVAPWKAVPDHGGWWRGPRLTIPSAWSRIVRFPVSHCLVVRVIEVGVVISGQARSWGTRPRRSPRRSTPFVASARRVPCTARPLPALVAPVVPNPSNAHASASPRSRREGSLPTGARIALRPSALSEFPSALESSLAISSGAAHVLGQGLADSVPQQDAYAANEEASPSAV